MQMKKGFLSGILQSETANTESENDFQKELIEQANVRIHRIVPDDKFIDSLSALMKQEKSASDRNRDRYFQSETYILFCTGIAGLLSALNANSALPGWMAVCLGIGAAVISFFSTFLIGLRGLRKWQETWLRHRNFLNLCYAELRKYANYAKPYNFYVGKTDGTEKEDDKLEMEYERQKMQEFKEAVLALIEQNNAWFMENMNQQK